MRLIRTIERFIFGIIWLLLVSGSCLAQNTLPFQGIPLVLTDAATVAVTNPSLSNQTTFTLLMTSGIGATRAIGAPKNIAQGQVLDFLIQQPASGGPFTATWNAAYTWANGSAPVLATTASSYTDVACKVLTTTPLLLCYGPVTSAAGLVSLAAPTAPASTSAFQAQGLMSGTAPIIPATTGNFTVTISGYCGTTGTVVGDGAQFYIMWQSGNGNVNGSATLGTQAGSVEACRIGTAVTTAADWNVPWSKTVTIKGLTIGTAYSVDLAGEALGVASTGKIVNVDVAWAEISQ